MLAGSGSPRAAVAATLTLCGGIVLGLLAGATGLPEPTSDRSVTAHFQPQVFRGGVELVQVTATVTDREGRLVVGLDRDDFEVYEDGKLQTISQFSRARLPVSLGVLLDVSDSMYGQRIVDARFAFDHFVATLLEPSDEAFVMTFNHEATLAADWTRPPGRLAQRLDAIRPWGSTALYDALLAALPMFERRREQRAALVMISDGADTASEASVRAVRARLRRSDPFVYAIGIDAGPRTPIHDQVNSYALRELTDESGGYTELVHDSSQLAEATQRIAEELNHQYTMGYSPARPPDGEYHRIRVRTKTDHVVRARRGYTAVPVAR